MRARRQPAAQDTGGLAFTSRALTRRQQDVLAYLEEHIETQGFAPTTEELAEACQLGSPSGAHRMLKALEEKRYLDRTPGRSRSIVLREPDQDLSSLTERELLILSMMLEIESVTRDTVLRVAASATDPSIKTTLIKDALRRHELVHHLQRRISDSGIEALTLGNGVTGILNTLRTDGPWSFFVVDYLLFNQQTVISADRFGQDHALVRPIMRRLVSIGAEAVENGRRWLDSVLAGADDASLEALQGRAETLVQFLGLTQAAILHQVGDDVAFRVQSDDLVNLISAAAVANRRADHRTDRPRQPRRSRAGTPT